MGSRYKFMQPSREYSAATHKREEAGAAYEPRGWSGSYDVWVMWLGRTCSGGFKRKSVSECAKIFLPQANVLKTTSLPSDI